MDSSRLIWHVQARDLLRCPRLKGPPEPCASSSGYSQADIAASGAKSRSHSGVRRRGKARKPYSAVYVRIGVHRYAYHTDADCPSLNGKQDTYKGQEEMSEGAAKKEGLKACQQCKK